MTIKTSHSPENDVCPTTAIKCLLSCCLFPLPNFYEALLFESFYVKINLSFPNITIEYLICFFKTHSFPLSNTRIIKTDEPTNLPNFRHGNSNARREWDGSALPALKVKLLLTHQDTWVRLS